MQVDMVLISRKLLMLILIKYFQMMMVNVENKVIIPSHFIEKLIIVPKTLSPP